MSNKSAIFICLAVLIFVSLSCTTLTGESQTAATDTVPVFGASDATPNLTMTAIFAPAEEYTSTSTDETYADYDGPTPTSILDDLLATATVTNTPTMSGTNTLIPVPTQTGMALNFESTDTYTSTTQRPGPSLSASYLSVLPNIDGDPGDWIATWYLADTVVFGEGYRESNRDISADFKLGWTQEYLLLAVVVRDTKFVQNASGAQLWLGDSLEVLLDTDISGDYLTEMLDEDDFHIGISPGQLDLKKGDPAEAYLWEPKALAGDLDEVMVDGRLTEGGYLMEVAIPWSTFDIVPVATQHFGFLFSVSDNDSVNEDEQQTIVSFAPERVLFDPTTWRDLVLQP